MRSVTNKAKLSKCVNFVYHGLLITIITMSRHNHNYIEQNNNKYFSTYMILIYSILLLFYRCILITNRKYCFPKA